MIATIAICFRYIWYNNHNLTMVTDIEASDWMKTQLASSDWLKASKSSPSHLNIYHSLWRRPLPEVASAFYNRDGQLGFD